jgi:hypothetical protein
MMIISMLGGTTGPMVQLAAVTAAVYPGHGRARDPGENQAGQNIDVRKTTALVPHQDQAKIEESAGDAGAVHDPGGQDEKRHSEQRKAEETGGNPLRNDEQGDVLDQEKGEGAEQHGERHRAI